MIDWLDAQPATDLWLTAIAAIVRSHGAILVTRNVTEFTGTGVTIVDPWNPQRRVGEIVDDAKGSEAGGAFS